MISVMNDNTKIEVAREIMNAMIGRYGKDGYNQSNTELMKLLADEKEMNNFNFQVIDKIIKVYGPLVRENQKLSKLNCAMSPKACQKRQQTENHEIEK